jgi:hypothetical protein
MKKNAALLALALVGVLLAGCSSNQHVYSANGKCVTCWNNPVTGKPINHDGEANKEVSPEIAAEEKAEQSPNVKYQNSELPFKEYKVSFVAPVEVDLAFLKLKKEFNYYTEQEIRQEWGSLANTKIQTFEYAYDATPSVYYHMRSDRQHAGVQVVIDTYIEKQSNRESKITLTYWLNNPTVNPSSFGASLKARAQKALSK